MPDILTDDVWSEYLSDEAQQSSRLGIRVDKAEMRVIEHYRQERGEKTVIEPSVGTFGADVVRLEEWATDADGNPDTSAMPDDLVRRLRIVIADVVEWRLQQEDREGVESKSEGSRSVSYDASEPAIPTRLFKPLEKYDSTEPFSGRW